MLIRFVSVCPTSRIEFHSGKFREYDPSPTFSDGIRIPLLWKVAYRFSVEEGMEN